MEDEIVKKLNDFLIKHKIFTEECHVVYLMVEIRKILDRENGHRYPLLRFYCDWTVHTEKGRITDEMKIIMSEIFQTVKAEIENPAMTRAGSPVMRFAYMENLKGEIKMFLEGHGISFVLVEEDNWIQFVQLLVNVLENQPIKNPIDEIVLFSFIPAAERCFQGIIKFKQPINRYDHYRFANAY
jgi:hypothetical protein